MSATVPAKVKENSDGTPRRSLADRLGRAVLGAPPFQAAAAFVLHRALTFIYRTNPPVAGSQDMLAHVEAHSPVIIAMWHGQQMLAQFTRPRGEPVAGLVSRSVDAEINARLIKLAGNEVVRGSGGRSRKAAGRKGGVAALIAMRDALRRGRHVVMIADISKGAPREAGEGIVALARISGRPIVPLALATSRHYVVKSAWDRMTINLPFGRRCLRLGEPIYVPADADEQMLADIRRRVTEDLNRVTAEAYRLVGRAP
ncbi:MAG: lysophospholipid acyltransferase family protein [Pararhizobium sp.]